MELAVTAFRLMAPALQAPSRDREVEMEVGVQATGTVAPVLEWALATLAEAARLVGVAEVADLAAETAGRLQALRLEVAVVGEFKRGKSSLINALIGREVLPVGVLPLTAVPTVLEQGEESLVVSYLDGLWVPKTPFISCGLGILMDEPAESIQPHDAFAGRWIGFGDGSERWRLTECAVRPVLVVVRQVARQHCLEMPLTQDQHPVEQLTTYGADPAFGERIRSRRTHRRPQDSDALGGEDRIEGVGELRVSVADEELKLDLLSAVGEVHEQVAGLLGHPRSGRVRRHAEDMNPAGRQLHHEQCIQALEQDRVYMEEVARHNPLGLRRQELSPRQPRAAGCRVDAGPLENQPHGTRRDRVPEPGEFTLDASVAPGRVLSCHPQDQAT
jgi:hypothetical protein